MIGMRIVFGYQCNYDCRFCYQEDKANRFNTFDEFIDAMEGVTPEFNPTYITCMGGELTLDPELEEKLKYLQTRYYSTPLSITTNGSGGFINKYDKAEKVYERLLSNYNLNITFSLPTIDDYDWTVRQNVNIIDYCNMIKNLRKKFPEATMRINAYIFPEFWTQVYRFAKINDLDLTLCEELRKDNQAVFEELPDIVRLVENGTFKKTRRNKHELVFTDEDGFQFWNYLHQDNYDYNNVIILPDGTLTDDFGDCVNQKGKL